jgi:UPF0176 protein
LQAQACAATAPAFRHFKVRLKNEIVSLGRPDVLPQQGVGEYVPPAQWNELVDDPDTLLIDTRNAYEVRVGHFPGAIHPESTSFREFPAWTSKELEPYLQNHPKRRLALFCTGGIRCEKATAFLLQEGFEQVYHLQGGILNYLRQIPATESRWSGECFVLSCLAVPRRALRVLPPGHPQARAPPGVPARREKTCSDWRWNQWSVC